MVQFFGLVHLPIRELKPGDFGDRRGSAEKLAQGLCLHTKPRIAKVEFRPTESSILSTRAPHFLGVGKRLLTVGIPSAGLWLTECALTETAPVFNGVEVLHGTGRIRYKSRMLIPGSSSQAPEPFWVWAATYLYTRLMDWLKLKCSVLGRMPSRIVSLLWG